MKQKQSPPTNQQRWDLYFLACFTYRLARTLTSVTARSQTRTSSVSMNSIWISDRKELPTYFPSFAESSNRSLTKLVPLLLFRRLIASQVLNG
jgi:hypothetical protein